MTAVSDRSPELPAIDLSLVTFHSARWLDGFFESLESQVYPLHSIHVWVRDNGSGDDTVRRLQFWAERLQGRLGSFALEEGDNIGFGRGHNANLARSQAAFVLVSNVDLAFEPNAIARVVEVARSDSEEFASWELRQKPFEHPKLYHPASLETLWSSHACVLLRRSALLSASPYEPMLFLYGEDVELSYRLRDHGYRLRYVPSAVCWHFTYDGPHQIKRAQFLGSKLANGLLRLRYGSVQEMLAVPFMYLALWCIRPRVPHYYRGLAWNGWRLLCDGPRFLMTRRQSDAPFPFRGWDYEKVRAGAFLAAAALPANPPLVSVVTRTMEGRLEGLSQALSSIANQTYPNIEVIVVEDGSGTAATLVEHFRDQRALRRVEHLPVEKGGRCRAGNQGLEQARGEFICFLDDDDMFFADHVEVMVATLLDDLSLGASYGLAFEVPATAIPQTGWGRAPLAYTVALRQPFSRALLWDHNYLPIQSVLFRRTLYETYGGLDEELENLEDWNLWVRYSQTAEFRLVDRVTSLYLVPVSGTRGMQRFASLESYRLKAARKNDLVRIALSPSEALEGAREIARYNTVFALRREALRGLALKLPLAGPLFHVLRRVGRAITRAGD